ncbi:uncharacterized protein [Nicotiana sylvestris]|uniref:uncharacterized protein n=1 Tax=Nicotiana sylvestris TaxID=4096 RepID=UPI00388C9FCB
MVHDAPPSVPVDVPTVTLPEDAVAQAQVQLNVAAPQITPQQFVQPVANTGQSKDFKNFMDLKPPEFDATQASIEPQKFIQHCEKILSTLGLKETRGVEFDTFLFSGSAESWWNSVQRGKRAGLPPITWSEFSSMFMDRFVPLSKRDDMRRQFEQLHQGSMTVTEYEAKFIDLASYAPFLVADEHEKVRRFIDGLEHCYRGPVVRDVRGGSYEEVVDTALRYESYQERDKTERESKRTRSVGGFSGAPSGGKSGFNRGQSRPTQSESVVQSFRSAYPAKQGQQQIQRKDNGSYQSGQHPRCSNCGRNHSGHCFGTDGACFTYGQKGHISKYCPRGYSATSHATSQPQRTFTGTQTQTQPARATTQVARAQG